MPNVGLERAWDAKKTNPFWEEKQSKKNPNNSWSRFHGLIKVWTVAAGDWSKSSIIHLQFVDFRWLMNLKMGPEQEFEYEVAFETQYFTMPYLFQTFCHWNSQKFRIFLNFQFLCL